MKASIYDVLMVESFFEVNPTLAKVYDKNTKIPTQFYILIL